MRARLDALWHDVLYALRGLARQPGFAAVVVLTIALGIGANAMMFGVIDRLLLRPPPHVSRPDELTQVVLRQTSPGEEPRSSGTLPYPFYAALREDTATFADVALETGARRYTLGRGPEATQIRGSLTSGNYFRTMGVRPALGRFFLPEEDREGVETPVTVLSHGFWQRHFGGARDVLGRTLHIGPGYFTIIGVAPKGFTGVTPSSVDVWIPIGAADGLRFVDYKWATNWGSFWTQIHARLRPGVPRDAAAARAVRIYDEGRPRRNPAVVRQVEFRSILPAEQQKDNPEAKVSRLLAAVAVLVLLIASANVANLLLARGTARRREIAVRLALGVSSGRLLRLLFLETMLLATIGGALALGIASLGSRVLRATLLSEYAWADAPIDGRVLAVTSLLVLVTGVLAGLAPALRASRPDVVQALKSGGREGSLEHRRLRAALIVVQGALSVLLLVGTGLFVRSLQQVGALHLGYETQRVLSATMDLEGIGYQRAEREALFQTMAERIGRIPGVASVSRSATHPLHGWMFGMSVRIPGRDSLPTVSTGGPYYNSVSAEFFATLGSRILAGRPITPDDIATDARVVVVNESLARTYWPGALPVGECVLMGSDSTCSTVVGVAEDARERLTMDEPRLLAYMPLSRKWAISTNVLLIRSAPGADPVRLIEPVRRAMQTAAPNLPFAAVKPMHELLTAQQRPWRLGLVLFGAFGALALVLAALGLYSAISYAVAQRTHEFGVRMAVGAQVEDVVQLVVGEGVRAMGIGLGLGAIGAWLAAGAVAPLLFKTSARDPVVYAGVAILLLVVAVLASLVPAWRATRVSPVVALRGD